MTRILRSALVFALVAIITVHSATVPICGKCLPRTVTLVPASGAGTVTPTVKMLANTAAGCRRMNVICTAPASATTGSMEFNGAFGGPYEAKTIAATLTCDASQRWRFTKGTVLIIKSVSCMYV
ncbi:hypothetical protein OESDEN_13520 [Oesophagostomum dentatum]|uniref:C6 domain-containing protein n=1 Tax=Oesophagostomum dentatum TaxID=61180 RepID=A0A0B1SS67_OESDE|nr:hypothetical protein OESDEN_13520 [Oesophagostomum dentatum]